jgi:hypothetical protein
LPCLIKRVAKVVPFLNGRDSNGNIVCLGPQRTKIHRYLLVLSVAESEPIFRSFGKEIDNSVCFTLYKLWTIANSFKDISPWYLPITYDRTKVAIKIYNVISNAGLVVIKKIDGHIFSLISYLLSNKHRNMGHVNFDNQDRHTSRTLA